MTTIAIPAFACKVCESISSFFKRTLKNYQFARQMAANREVARQMIHLGYNQQKEYEQILQKMNDKTIEEYHSRY